MTLEKLKVVDFKFDRIPKADMASSRGYAAHTSTITSIELFEDRQVLTTSLSD